MQPTTRRRLMKMHRWIAIGSSPVLLALAVTGGILAFEPLSSRSESAAAAAPPPVDVAALRRLLAKPALASIDGFVVFDSQRVVTTLGAGRSQGSSYLLATGDSIAFRMPEARPGSEQFFNRVLRIHKDLWTGAGGLLVTLGSFSLAILVLTGPLLGKPGSRRGLIGWHRWSGWVLWPLLALAPVSLVLMKAHGEAIGRAQPDMTISEVLDTLAGSHDLGTLRVVQRIRNGSTFVVLEPAANESRRYVVRRNGITEIDTRTSRVGRAIHSGAWADGWGGMLNLAAALALFGMLATGVVSWRRRAPS